MAARGGGGQMQQGTANPNQNLGTGIGSMSYFTSSGVLQQVGGAVPVDRNHIIEIHLRDPNGTGYSLIAALVADMTEEEDPYQLCGHICSLITFFCPSILEVVERSFAELGVSTYTIDSDAGRIASCMNMESTMCRPEGLVFLGQAILILCKNIHSTTYDNFMRNRIAALCRFAGVLTPSCINTILPLAKAEIVKRIIGSHFVLKKEIVEMVLNTAVGVCRPAHICSYIAGILEYDGMAHLAFIYETLTLPRSPALAHPSLRLEVLNLAEAFKEVRSTAMPKYFKLLNHPSLTRVTERSRFKTIASLAETIKFEQTSRARQFVTSRSQHDPRVAALKQIHDNYVNADLMRLRTYPSPLQHEPIAEPSESLDIRHLTALRYLFAYTL